MKYLNCKGYDISFYYDEELLLLDISISNQIAKINF